MPIKLDLVNNKLQVKIISSPNFNKDKDFLFKLPGRKPVYEGESFQYWEFPLSSLSSIVDTWGDTILASDNAKSLLDNFAIKSQDIEQLPRESLLIDCFDGKSLKPYQESYVTINNQKKVLLASFSTGTGKTRSSLVRARNSGCNNILIIGPKKLRFNWRTEVREVLGEETLIFWDKTPKGRERLALQVPNYRVWYATFETAGELIKANPQIDAIIVDEIHAICNPKTISNKAITQILRNHKGSIQGLSATPMRLKMEDLWGVLNLLDPEIAGSKFAFLDKYQQVLSTIPVRKNGRVFNVPVKVRSKNEKDLREKLKSIMVRVKKDTVVSFKDNVEILDVELTPRQKHLYQEAEEALQIELTQGLLKVPNPLARMTRLLQISEGLFNLDSLKKDSGKLDFMKEELGERLKNGEKIVVWSRFEPITREIKALFPDQTVIYSGGVSEGLKNLAVWGFQGVTNNTDRDEFDRIKSYHKDFKLNPGEAQIFAGTHSLVSGLGINLHSSNITYFTSYDWNPNAIFQARDRISRLGQEKDTETYFIVSEDTIERKCLRLILDNYYNSLELLDGGGGTDAKLTKALIGVLMNG